MTLPSTHEQTMARAAKTFYRAARLLPADIRTEVIGLYAFCRYVDDLADEPAGDPAGNGPEQGAHTATSVTDPSLPAQREAALRHLAEALEAQRGGTLPGFGPVFAAHPRLAPAAALLVRAAMGDLQQHQPASDAHVLDYAFGVAGTVGLMMAEVLRARPAGLGGAVALGMAMQLSNVCRDVAEDLGNGRVYLPATRVSADEVRVALQRADTAAAQRTTRATLHLLAQAEQLYRLAFDALWSLPWRLRWSILAAGLCYREIGRAVGRDVPRSWRRRTVVSARRKLWLVALAGARLLLPRFWRHRSPTAAAWPAQLGSEAFLQARRLGMAA